MPNTDETEGLNNPETPEGTHQPSTPEGTQADHTPEPDNTEETPEKEELSPPPSAGEGDEPEAFPREYVEKLRTEAAENRVKAKKADDLGQRLHVALVAATGRLADPDDLAYSDEHLDDPDALTAALDALLERKPHLASRRVSGGVGQGTTSASGTVDLAGLLRARA